MSHKSPLRSNRNERGSTIVLFTFVTVLVLIPVIGLAIDGSIVMWEKARLSASVDAAALAAGRALSANSPDGTEATLVSQTADEYFQANFQIGSMGTKEIPNPDGNNPYILLPTNNGYRKVTVERSVTVPLIFMRTLGFNTTTLTAIGQASRRDVNVILVLDRSSSMNTARPDGSIPCQTMIQSAEQFVNYFVDGRDQLSLITFHAATHLDYAPTKYFKSSNPSMASVIGKLVCGSNTSSAAALNLAYQTLQNPLYALPGALNVIVFFTDGQPNGVAGTFPILQASSESRWDVAPNTSNPVTAKQSTCLSSIVTGVIAQWAGGAIPNGDTEGVFNQFSTSISDTSEPIIGDPNCTTVKKNSGKYMRQDIAYIPMTDLFGNLTTGYMTQPSDYVSTGPNKNLGFRLDVPQALVDASFNAADDQAKKIRNDTTYNPVIYSIGLGGAPDAPTEQIFQTFLTRVSNDPSSPIYDASRPAGLFVYSPSTAELNSAFSKIASQVLSISQ